MLFRSQVIGKVIQVVGLVVEAQVQGVFIGELCRIQVSTGTYILAEIVGFKEEKVLLMPLGKIWGIRPGCRIYASGEPVQVKVGMGLLGRVLNGLGEPMDEKGDIEWDSIAHIDKDPPDPIKRPRISQTLKTGIKAIDGVLTNVCPPPTTDQRGVARPQSARCDIGAFELEDNHRRRLSNDGSELE